MNRIIYSLFDYTGNWSAPYDQAGYSVIRFDLKHGKGVLSITSDLYPAIGKPVYKFHPYYFGDLYKKETCLYGRFNIPQDFRHLYSPLPYPPGDAHPIDHYYGVSHLPFEQRKPFREITPPGFAKAFFQANP